MFMLYLMKLKNKFIPYMMNIIEFIVQVLISPRHAQTSSQVEDTSKISRE